MMAYVLFLGFVIGFGCGYACWQAKFGLLVEAHKRELDEQIAEVKRLRTQVARLVGKPLVELKLAA